MQNFSPIVIFAFNRPETLKATVKSLLLNKEASNSDLYIFVDGPRVNNPKDDENVRIVRSYVQTIEGFKSIKYSFSEENRGLAPSIIAGVTKVLDIHNRAIVLEDDLYVAPGFLKFMNLALVKFENDERVFQVSGYCPKLKNKFVRLQDVFFNRRAQSWSWGTWRDRWESIDWNVIDFNELKSDKHRIAAFNKNGSDLFGMLSGYMEGRNSSWYVRFCYSMHKQNKFSVCPTRSLVRNDGFDGEGTHCNNYNRYRISFDDRLDAKFNFPDNMVWIKALQQNAIKYWSIPYRVYGKLMTYLLK